MEMDIQCEYIIFRVKGLGLYLGYIGMMENVMETTIPNSY